MNGNSLLIDTNIVLYLLKGDVVLSEVLDGKIAYISFISELELLSYPDLTKHDEEILKQFISECIVIDINREIKIKTIALRKIYQLKLPDAIIAATADYLKQPIITADKDFKKIDSIDLIFYEK